MAATTRQRSGRGRSRSRRRRTGGRGGTHRGRRWWRARRPRRASLISRLAGRHWPSGLTQTQRDVLGLALCALGLFMAFVLYGRWDGGGVGHGLAAALGFGIGRARWLAPPLLLIGGAALVWRPAASHGRPLRAGALCVLAGVMLALAAGTLGVSPGPLHTVGESTARAGSHMRAGAPSQWGSAYVEDRGGIVGQALWWSAHGLVRDVGVDILVCFLLLAGVSLLSGVSLLAMGRALARALRLLAHSPSLIARALHGRLRMPLPAVLRWALDDGLTPDATQDRPPRAASSGQAASLAGDGWADPLYNETMPTASRGGDGALAAGEAAREQAGGTDAVHSPEMGGAAPGQAKLTVKATHVEGPPLDGVRASEAGSRGQGHAEQKGSDEPARQGGGGSGAESSAYDALTPQGRMRGVVTDDPAFAWRLPEPTAVLMRSRAAALASDEGRAGNAALTEGGRSGEGGHQERVAAALLEALGHFGVQAKVIGTVMGPHITRYELRLAPGTKVAKVAQLKDDLAYALAATDIRILAPIPGKQAVGVEVPNTRRRIVRLGDVFQEPPRDWSPLTVWLGKDVAGKAIGADLARMPHLLVAGATGSGKSGAINAMLSSVLLRATPHEARLVLVDPKQVELNHYESIPHLLTPVITNPRMAANALANLVREMEQRYGIMSLARTRSLPELNSAREHRGEPPLPYILCVIDELADLMMVAPADVEDSVIRLAQKARAVGIHLVLATQSPRVDVITGMIKANVPSRIAFAVSSQTDSRVILDQNGAETLLGQGDMLFSPMGSAKLQRIQGAYIDEPQIAKITDYWRRQGEPELREELLEQVEAERAGEGADDERDPDRDPLLGEAITLVAEMQTASTSMMQRRLRVGYTRAGRLVDMLERRGIISGYEGSKPRQVLISEADLPRVLATLPQGPSASAAPDRLDSEIPPQDSASDGEARESAASS